MQPKGTIIVECGKMLSDAGYKIKVLNTINFKKSMRYNPFHYIRSEKDILKLVNTIIANTKGDGEKSGEDFWVKAERLLYCALIGYIWYEAPEEEQNFSTLLEFINASEAREDDEEFKNAVDELFEELEKKKPEHFAVRQYKKYTKELWIDRREKSKSLAWSSVLLALRNIKKVGEVVDRPKALGDIRGVTYIYGMFYRFGLIDVPDEVKEKMKRSFSESS